MKYGLNDSSSWRNRPTLLPVAKRAHALVGALVDVPLLAGRREVRVGLLVLQQHAVAVHEDVGDEAAAVRERDALLLDAGRPPAAWRWRVERVVGRLEVLGQVDVRDVERVAVLVEAVGRAVGGQIARQGDARHVEQVADRVLVLGPRQPAQAAIAGGWRPSRRRRANRAAMLTNAWRSSAVGWSASFGGISPALDAVVDLHPAGESAPRWRSRACSAVRSSPPSCVSASWQAAQCFAEERRRIGAWRGARGQEHASCSDPGRRKFARCSRHLQPAHRALAGRELLVSIPRRCSIETYRFVSG